MYLGMMVLATSLPLATSEKGVLAMLGILMPLPYDFCMSHFP